MFIDGYGNTYKALRDCILEYGRQNDADFFERLEKSTIRSEQDEDEKDENDG